MLAAFYIGNHEKDGIAARAGYKIIRFGQTRQRFGNATHCEAILDVLGGGKCIIASASFRDHGVRTKVAELNPLHWIILDVPSWDKDRVRQWFIARDGEKYSVVGAASSASLMVNLILNAIGLDPSEIGQWCSRALGESAGMVGAEDMSVCELMCQAWNLPGTIDVTASFFAGAAN